MRASVDSNESASRRVPHAPPAAASGGARTSSKFGTVNYSVEEMRRLVAKVRAVMPAGADDWLRVAYEFNYLRPEAIPYREAESLKRKFKKMYCSRGARLPTYVEEAKELRRVLSARAASVPSAAEPKREELLASGEPRAAAKSDAEQLTAGSSSSVDDECRPSRTAARRAPRAEEPVESGSDGTGAAPATTTTAPPSQLVLLPDAPSSTGIIALLQHSVERKRRTAEEQALSESERVRKERKKRKVEQVLLSIHQEQRERELLLPDSTASLPTAAEATAATAAARLATTLPTLQQAADSSGDLKAAVSVLERTLQFLIAQQRETAVRLQQEHERRERKQRLKAQRRREKERRRRRDTRDLMQLLAAALDDKFPDALRHHLTAATPSASESEGDDDDDNEDNEDDDIDPSSRTATTSEASAESQATGGGESLPPTHSTAAVEAAVI